MENEKKSNGKVKKILISILVILMLLGGIGIGYYLNKPEETQWEKDVNKITEMSKEDQQAAVNQRVEDGMMNVQYQIGATFKGKISESFNVKNIENNKDSIQFKLYDENDNLIYESDAIERGYEINKIELDKELSKGTHECTIQIGYVSQGNVSSSFPITIEVK